MARSTAEILAEIGFIRMGNKTLYREMKKLLEHEDHTLKLVTAAYAVDPVAAKQIHRQILANDAAILELTKELCE